MSDPNAGVAGSAGTDPGAAGAAGAPPATTDPTADPNGSSLIDLLQRLIALDPRVREATAMRRILDAMNQSGGAPPDVAEALDALGDMDCRRNTETCVAVCSWAVSNCSHCSGDADCMAKLGENCFRSTCR